MTPHTHSYAHVNELAYQAIRKALDLGEPVLRDAASGRFISRKESKSKQLREELAAINNAPVQAEIEANRDRGSHA